MKKQRIITLILVVVLMCLTVSTAMAYLGFPNHSWSAIMPTRSVRMSSTVYNDVKAIQKILKLQGYYESSIDGLFGTGTRSAVMEFQADQDIDDDGVVGEDSWGALQEQLHKRTSNPSSSCGYSVDNSNDSTIYFYHKSTGEWTMVSPSCTIR